MKRLLFLIILTLILTTKVFAGTFKSNLTLKSENDFGVYNDWITDYQNLLTELHFVKIWENCWGNNTQGGGFAQVSKNIDCEYYEFQYLIKKKKLNTKNISQITHRLYLQIRDINTIWLKAKQSDANVRTMLVSLNNARKNWFREMELEIKQAGLRANKKYYAQKKQEEEEKGFDFTDDEIIAASSGSGFLVSKNGYMITNHHVIDGCVNVKALFNSKEYNVNIIATDKVNDLAIIKAELKSEKFFSVSNNDAQLLEEVIVAGYPLGKQVSEAIKATTGTITALAGMGDNYAEFQTDAALNSGNSGGPILNSKGNVVGIAVAKIQEEGVESFNFGIKSSILQIFAKANNIKFVTPNNKEMKKKDLGELITKATIYLDCWMTGKDLKALIASQETSQKAFHTNLIK